MTINGTDVESFGARQFLTDISPHSIKNASEWPDGAILPAFQKNYLGMQTLTAILNVFGENQQDIRMQISGILALCQKTADISLDRYDHKFRGILTSATPAERKRNRKYQLTLKFSGYEYGKTVRSKNGKIYNPGNIDSPCRIVVTGRGDIDLKIGDYYEAKLSGSTSYILDSIKGILSPASGIDVWELPHLKPGRSVITAGSASIEASCMPLYM